ncbi:hypothetical protein J2853_002910 [Streptosporangium lutulentum]|uniref:Uncharacterized protein n=1 Tax=Streptosporangium lutulentum TaxID=1461250 RepID=A0ABT9QCN9_9ACTN|nr:hypothetical protein [Streptosporangium lutulentum]
MVGTAIQVISPAPATDADSGGDTFGITGAGLEAKALG